MITVASYEITNVNTNVIISLVLQSDIFIKNRRSASRNHILYFKYIYMFKRVRNIVNISKGIYLKTDESNENKGV